MALRALWRHGDGAASSRPASPGHGACGKPSAGVGVDGDPWSWLDLAGERRGSGGGGCRPSFRLSGRCGATATARRAAGLPAQATRRVASRRRGWESTEISGLSWICAEFGPVFCSQGAVAPRRRRHSVSQAIWQGVTGETFVSFLGLQGYMVLRWCESAYFSLGYRGVVPVLSPKT